MKSTLVQSEGHGVRSGVLVLLVLLLKAAALAQSSQAGLGPSVFRARRHVLVSISDRKLAVLEDGKVIRIFPVSVGASVSPSPTGEFHIVTRIPDPTYYRPGIVIPPGKDNPVGTRWVGLSQKGFGIHGTNDPGSIGKAASHGCIRMRNRDIEQFFVLINVGDTVEVRADRNQEIAQVFGGSPAATWVAVMPNTITAAENQGQ